MAGSFSGNTYTGDATNEKVSGTSADETIIGQQGSDTLRGGGGDDQLYADSLYGYFDGSAAVDKLFGDAGDDELHGFALARNGNALDGGVGEDEAFISADVGPEGNGSKPFVFALNEKGSFATLGGAKLLFVKNVETLDFDGNIQGARITGGAGDDRISASGNGSTLSGGGGSDYISTSLAGGFKAVVNGGAGDTDSVNLSNYSSSEPLTLKMSGSFAKGLTLKSGSAVVATVKGMESISVRGGSGNDSLFGGSRSDSLGGGQGGNDTLRGLGGDDNISVTVGAGRSKVSGDAGEDYLDLFTYDALGKNIVMSGSLAKLAVKYGGALSVSATGFERVGATTGKGDDSVFGGALNDRFVVGTGANSVKAGGGDDAITTSLDAKLDKIDGGSGDDKLTFEYGIDTAAIVMKASASGTGFSATLGGKAAIVATGIEQLNVQYGSNFADTLIGLRGDDSLSGGDGNDKISGGKGDDSLSGGAGNDQLKGGAGDDRLFGGEGVDLFDGGAGVDTARLGGTGEGINVTLASTKTVSVKAGAKVVATLVGIEGLFGGSGDDTITGDRQANTIGGGGGDNKLNGGLGTDTLDYSSLNTFGLDGVTVTLKGATPTKATVPGLGIPGFPGSEGSTDTIRNFENVTGSNAADTLTGDGKANVLNGGDGADTLKGGGGNDTLIDGTGFSSFGDAMEGGAGNDTYEVGSSGSFVKEAKGAGTDTVMASTSFTLSKGQAVEKIVGVAGIFGPNTPISYHLIGNELANTIQGWLGSDTLKGGGGKDTFVFKTDLSNGYIDTITDFDVKADTIALGRSVFKALGKAGDLDGSAFLVGTAAKTANQHILYDNKNGFLYYDSDGSKKAHDAVAFALLDPHLKLSADDFQIV